MTTVTADFPAAIEYGTAVLAALLTGTWTEDFGPDLGPDLGGGAQVEWLAPTTSTLAGDSLAPIEAAAQVSAALLTSAWSRDFSSAFGPLSGGGAPVEAGAGVPMVRGDALAPIDVLTVQRKDAATAAEAALAVRKDAPMPVEAPGRIVYADPNPQIEMGATARADPLAQAEDLGSFRIDAGAPGEATAVQRVDQAAPVEQNAAMRTDQLAQIQIEAAIGMIRADALLPIEALALQRADLAPIEWAALFRIDAAAPAEAILAVRADPGVPGESIAVYRLDLGSALEALSAAARIDLAPRIEALLSAVRDGAYVEAGSALLVHQAASGEALTGLRIDPGVPAEAGGSIARVDATAPTEALLTALGGRGALAEFLSTVQPRLIGVDTNAPIEWAAIFRADGMPIAEWAALSTATLMAEDQSASSSGCAGLATTIWRRSPSRAARRHRAPVLFVGRGRLARSPGRLRVLKA